MLLRRRILLWRPTWRLLRRLLNQCLLLLLLLLLLLHCRRPKYRPNPKNDTPILAGAPVLNGPRFVRSHQKPLYAPRISQSLWTSRQIKCMLFESHISHGHGNTGIAIFVDVAVRRFAQLFPVGNLWSCLLSAPALRPLIAVQKFVDEIGGDYEEYD